MSRSPSDFLLSLQDPKNGGFRFAVGCPATLVATGYAVLGLEFLGTLKKMRVNEKSRVASFLLSALGTDGCFRDPLFRKEDILSPAHDLSYFEDEANAFCLQALDALGEKAPVSDVPSRWANPQILVSYLNALSWKDPWLESNRVMFALSRLCYEAEKNGRTGHLASVDKALDWLDTQQSKKTGLWHGRAGAGNRDAMAAAVHFIFFYSYRRRPVRFTERIIDSCLSLQADEGLFGETNIGHTCFDYDAIQLLSTLRRSSGHRHGDVGLALTKAASALRALQNTDGGFAEAKFRRRRFLGRPLLMVFSQKITSGWVNNCWKHLSCPVAESNAFSTWLRPLTLALAEEEKLSRRAYRHLPFLGYNQPS